MARSPESTARSAPVSRDAGRQRFAARDAPRNRAPQFGSTGRLNTIRLKLQFPQDVSIADGYDGTAPVIEMGSWTLDDIPWNEFDPSRIDPELVPIVKAASMVERNAEDYRRYLNGVFQDDPRMRSAVDRWAKEEVQHGRALGRWAALADPEFDFERRFERFKRNFRLPLDADRSVRGSRTGELVARCMVETGTNSFYTALADAADEPVLEAICRRIADDEYAHYHLFFRNMCRYLDREGLNRLQRLRVALGRIAETEDDELASAYWAANADGEPYDRRVNAAAYARSALKFYRPRHIARSVEMIFDAVGFDPDRAPGRLTVRAVRAFVWFRSRLMPRIAVARFARTGRHHAGQRA